MRTRPEDGSAAVFVRNRAPDFSPRGVSADVNSGRRALWLRQSSGFGDNRGFYVGNDPVCFLRLAVDHQPARAFGNPLAEKENGQAQERAQSKSQPPSEPKGKVPRDPADRE